MPEYSMWLCVRECVWVGVGVLLILAWPSPVSPLLPQAVLASVLTSINPPFPSLLYFFGRGFIPPKAHYMILYSIEGLFMLDSLALLSLGRAQL